MSYAQVSLSASQGGAGIVIAGEDWRMGALSKPTFQRDCFRITHTPASSPSPNSVSVINTGSPRKTSMESNFDFPLGPYRVGRAVDMASPPHPREVLIIHQ